MKKLREFLGFLIILLGVVVFLSPVYWAFANNPLYLLLMMVSWLPGTGLILAGTVIFKD